MAAGKNQAGKGSKPAAKSKKKPAKKPTPAAKAPQVITKKGRKNPSDPAEQIKEAAKLVMTMDVEKIENDQVSYTQVAAALSKLYKAGTLDNLTPALPLLLALKGAPYSLRAHFPMEPFFSLKPPRRTVMKCGRQVAKSTTLAARICVTSSIMRYFSTLYIAPRFDQTKRFSTNYVSPFLTDSPIGRELARAKSNQSVLERQFPRGSIAHFSYAFLDCDRVRGISSDCNMFDEVQDIDSSFLPIINETLSASPYGFRYYSGTPKTYDNPLQTNWDKSSQAEWVIPCPHCMHWNIPSVEQDMLKMIQKIGLCCAKCEKKVDPQQGMWIHAFPNLAHDTVGFHAPQPIFPMHYAPDLLTGSMEKWREIYLAKEGEMDIAKFYNEKLGESYDVRIALLTKKDLVNASRLSFNNNYREALKHASGYHMKVLGVDWGGGGEDEISLTAIAVLGFRPNGSFDVIYMDKLSESFDHYDEAALILKYFKTFNCSLLGHDFGGSGDVREAILVHSGFDVQRLFPACYVRAAVKKMVTYHPPTAQSGRSYYSVDKARAVTLLCHTIKNGLVRFPRYKSWERYSEDFLALVEDKHHVARGADVYLIDKKANQSDDLVHAVNFAALAYWHSQGRYPNLAKAITSKISAELAAHVHPDHATLNDWEER